MTEAEARAEVHRLEDEISRIKHETAGVKGQVAIKAKELADAKHRTSAEYEAELRQRLLVLDHRDAFREAAKTAGFVSPKAAEAAWKIMQQDGLYKVVGPPTKAAIEHALDKFRESYDWMFHADRQAPDRWSPSGPLTFSSNGASN